MAASILNTILSPQSIAIVGASRDPHKRGFRSIQKLIDDGYAGTILPVNPRETEILGLPCYPDLLACPVVADLAVYAPARSVPVHPAKHLAPVERLAQPLHAQDRRGFDPAHGGLGRKGQKCGHRQLRC